MAASLGGAAPSADTSAPTVSLTAPTNGASVSGAVSVTATATDNVGVAGVQFRLNGVNLGAEEQSAPYAISWNTTQTPNGNHTLTAIARDAAGNQAVAGSISVTVNNVAQPVNRAPTISGAPASSIAVGAPYSFQPAASDADGDALTFSIANKPVWATFSASTGRLSGTPAASHVGTYANITISVSDGKASAALAPFAITVNQISTGSVTLSWTPPTQNTDGSALTNLAGYRLYYGASPSALTQMIQIDSAGFSTYVVEGLSPGTWYFAMRAYNAAGAESANTSVASKLVQ
jgi:Bacterial Ig domain/Putative Ig domain